jgi:hypothetical protein
MVVMTESNGGGGWNFLILCVLDGLKFELCFRGEKAEAEVIEKGHGSKDFKDEIKAREEVDFSCF